MKRVKAACILQTLVFAQKDDCGLTHEQQLKVNHDEVSRYKAMMDRSRTRYQITEETEQSDGSGLVRSKNEVGELADTFNTMLEDLEVSFQRERQFTSDASHELRTPMTVIPPA